MDEISAEEFIALQPHPFANLLPWIKSTAEFGDLVEDIRKNGLVSPIILFQGLILDGRNRHKACSKLLADGAFEFHAAFHLKRFNGTDAEALDYVESLNVKRRHLTSSQRAYAVASMIALRTGGPPARTGNSRENEATVSDAAASAGVSAFMVIAAQRLRASCPEHICKMIEEGSVTVAAAQRVAGNLSRARLMRLTTPEKVNAAASIAGSKRFKSWTPNRLVENIDQLAQELAERDLSQANRQQLEAAIDRLKGLLQTKSPSELQPA